jgi:hypothetical protein
LPLLYDHPMNRKADMLKAGNLKAGRAVAGFGGFGGYRGSLRGFRCSSEAIKGVLTGSWKMVMSGGGYV